MPIIIQGTPYDMPDDFTVKELKLFRDMGADVPDGSSFDAYQMAAVILIVKRRAGEVITLEAIDELKASEIRIEEQAENGGPPPNRAARRGKSGGRATQAASSGSQS